MPRASRAAAGGFCYNVLNRGNARAEVFHKDGDYDAFIKIIAEASLRNPMRVLAYCLMSNHFHLALWPAKDGDLSRWMQWLLTTYVRRYQRHYHSNGHIWQGRFKAFPVQGLRTTFSCVFEGFSRELSSNHIIHTNCN
ncbi:MAG: transposase, partial [Isosphaeraceae bacterium]